MFSTLLEPKTLSGTVNIGVLVLRITLGILMLTHGYPKFEKMLAGDMSFGNPIFLGEELSLILTVFAEFVCSILLIFGLLTRPAVSFSLLQWRLPHLLFTQTTELQNKKKLFCIWRVTFACGLLDLANTLPTSDYFEN